MHSAALVGSAGVPARDFLPYAVDNADSISMYLAETARTIDERSYPGDQGTAAMMGATADHIAAASRDAGIDTVLPDAVKSLYDRTIAAGHGKDSWAAMNELVRRRLP